jgi:hypothetical protein
MRRATTKNNSLLIVVYIYGEKEEGVVFHCLLSKV